MFEVSIFCVWKSFGSPNCEGHLGFLIKDVICIFCVSVSFRSPVYEYHLISL